jgi:hypothetical protein
MRRRGRPSPRTARRRRRRRGDAVGHDGQDEEEEKKEEEDAGWTRLQAEEAAEVKEARVRTRVLAQAQHQFTDNGEDPNDHSSEGQTRRTRRPSVPLHGR